LFRELGRFATAKELHDLWLTCRIFANKRPHSGTMKQKGEGAGKRKGAGKGTGKGTWPLAGTQKGKHKGKHGKGKGQEKRSGRQA